MATINQSDAQAAVPAPASSSRTSGSTSVAVTAGAFAAVSNFVAGDSGNSARAAAVPTPGPMPAPAVPVRQQAGNPVSLFVHCVEPTANSVESCVRVESAQAVSVGRAVSARFECSNASPATTALADTSNLVAQDAVAHVAEGYNACVLVFSNDATTRRQVFPLPLEGVGGIAGSNSARTAAPGSLVHSVTSQLYSTLAAKVASFPGMTTSVQAACLGITGTLAVDLLPPAGTTSSPALLILEDDFEGVHVRGLTWYGPVDTASALQRLLTQPNPVASTVSHRCILLNIKQTFPELASSPPVVITSQLMLVDVGEVEHIGSHHVTAGGSTADANAWALKIMADCLAAAAGSVTEPYAPGTTSAFGLFPVPGVPHDAQTVVNFGASLAEAPLFDAFPTLTSFPGASPFAATPLLQLLSEQLAGNARVILAVPLSTAATHEGPALTVMNLATTLCRHHSFPVMNAPAVRGLLCGFRRRVRLLRCGMRNLQESAALSTASAAASAEMVQRDTELDREESFLTLSRQLIDSELQNSELREALAAAQMQVNARAASSSYARYAPIDAEESYQLARARRDVEDAQTEIRSLRSALRAKGIELRSSQEMVLALQHKLARFDDDVNRHRGLPVGDDESASTDEVSSRQVAALIQVVMQLRSRVAATTTNAEEYAAMTTPPVNFEQLVAPIQATPTDVIPRDVFRSDTGRALSYAELTAKAREADVAATRLHDALEIATRHIRSMRAAQPAAGEAAAAAAAAAADLSRLESKVSELTSTAERQGAQLHEYKKHLVAARDALVAATKRRATTVAEQEELAKHKQQVQELRTALLHLQERCGKLQRENAAMQSLLGVSPSTSALRSPPAHPSDSSAAMSSPSPPPPLPLPVSVRAATSPEFAESAGHVAAATRTAATPVLATETLSASKSARLSNSSSDFRLPRISSTASVPHTTPSIGTVSREHRALLHADVSGSSLQPPTTDGDLATASFVPTPPTTASTRTPSTSSAAARVLARLGQQSAS